MTPDRWQQVKTVLDAALDRDAAQRAAFLAETCGEDAALRGEVDSLLASERQIWDFLDRPAFVLHPKDNGDDAVGRRIGPYVLQRRIGHGGMGSVYLAKRRDDFEKKVAIKLLRRGMDTDEIVRRFRVERQILAQLEHPNIARLLDGGSTDDGLPYFVVEYVEGEPIDRYCDRHRLSIRRRLLLFRQVCAAVQVAHQSLVVHRDLKPDNILVTREGVPKLLDFGIAKLLGNDPGPEHPVTEIGLRLMTPHYASPEQIRGGPITTASDIYALGILLYRLLTGRQALDLPAGATAAARVASPATTPERPSVAVRRHDDDEPARARGEGDLTRLSRRLRGDLDAIVLEALRPEPEDRYGSVERLSEDVRRHLEGFPVDARRGTTLYALGRFARRHRWPVAAAAFFVLLLAGFAVRESTQRRQLAVEKTKAEQTAEFLEDLLTAADPNESKGETLTVREILDRGAREIDEELAAQPEVRAGLLESMGRAYRRLGLYDEAERLIRDVVTLRREVAGDGPEVAVGLLLLAGLRRDQSDPEGAEALIREALEIQERHLAPDDLEYLVAQNNLAGLLREQGKLREAERVFRRVLAAEKRFHGDDVAAIDSTENNLATVLRELEEYDEATTLLRSVVDRRRRAHGDLNDKVITSLGNLAAAYQSSGDLDAAEPLMREVLASRRKMLGDDHPKVSRSLSNLATLLQDKGDLEGAAAGYREALAGLRRRQGDDHLNVAIARNNLGTVLAELGDHAAATRELTEAVRIARAKYERPTQHTALFLRNLAHVRSLAGDHAGALPLAREALVIRRGELPAGGWQVADAESVLGGCLAGVGRLHEARPLLEGSVAVLREKRGPEAWHTRQAIERLARFHHRRKGGELSSIDN